MKIDPITFRSIYEMNVEGPLGFILNRHLVATPFFWHGGAAISFTVIDEVNTVEFDKRDRKVLEVIYYDSDNSQYQTLMENLASGELRGKTAENTAHMLFFNLFAFSSFFKEFFPRIYDLNVRNSKGQPGKTGLEFETNYAKLLRGESL